jgi:hypothetical protein
VRARIAEEDEHAVAHEPGDEAVVARDRRRRAVLVGADHVPQVLGVQAVRQRRRAHEVAEHHGELPPLRRTPGRASGSLGREGAAAAAAEALMGLVDESTPRARGAQRRSARGAEPPGLAILGLALAALHRNRMLRLFRGTKGQSGAS